MDEMSSLRITWDAAPDEIGQAAEMITFHAAHPSAAGDDTFELDFFIL
jgi:hypothetical protein